MVETLSEQILRENAEVLDAMLGHRFVEDIKADRLPTEVFERYLVFEGAFVDTAISIFAFAAAKAETMAQKRWLIGVLDALANQQIAYFEKTFAARGIDPQAFDHAIPEVAAFQDGMLAIARDGGYLDTVAAMFAAEWMYWTWSRQAAARQISDPLLKEWVDLHAHPDFAAQALWLKAELDRAGEGMSETERSRLSAIFGQAQSLEIAFHDAPYL
ncbi:transcriptional activator, TenA family protein [Agrobacterium albertimagni AOL15]|uniref:Aminopyrimidine aminohydrolase n=1 Tax=Agrobacterium albertimagni AOL15 TaxID=1156935 RepID=K2PG48_9HYPH|nr:TenA family protein [Agrobacterium albertimagni]EKF59853.1 transcriptional activator, TenA family protein [Agrobacterium albertimagni AOL15]